jgi:hypothetical protein
MAYQQIPDSILWFVLEDGSMAACTFQAEHEVVGWSRHMTPGTVGTVACLPAQPPGRHTELWAAVTRNSVWGVERMAARVDETLFTDDGLGYESSMETLRINIEGRDGFSFPAKKLIARLAVYAAQSGEAWIAPGGSGETANRDKRRMIRWDWENGMTESEIQLDSGFRRDASVQIWTEDHGPLTILAVAPIASAGN